MVEWSLDALADASSIGEIVVVVPADEDTRHPTLATRAKLVEGGPTRSESVRNGLELVETEIVAVHDAARPLVTPELVDALVEELFNRPDAAAVIAAARITDTVKSSPEPQGKGAEAVGGSPTVTETLSRDHLWVAQTPQVFRTEALREAMDADPRRLAAATDDAWLLEQAGGKVLMLASPAENLKVTTPNDLRVAELLLETRR
jgi:2-C-methyl-D-erythritol 4-phosphate cytidylyltransferase